MITWLVGENTFEVKEALKAIEARFDGVAEKFDATELSLAQLPDLLMGVSLFATQRLVVIKDITANSVLWDKLPEWLPRVSDMIELVLIDTKPDKRTTVYKALKAAVVLKEFPAWTDRDYAKAEQWVSARAKTLGITIGKPEVRHLVDRVGVDQWQLASALDTLHLLDDISTQTINDIVPANPTESVFSLLEVSLEGNGQAAATIIQTLSLQEDPYGIFGLITSQVLTLAAVTYSEPTDTVAKDFAVHPFVASKLGRHAQKLGKNKVAAIVSAAAQTDAEFKRSKAEPWLLVEKFLLTTAQIVK